MKSSAARPFDLRGLSTGIGLGIVHLGALCAFIPGTFNWGAVVVMLVLYYITGAWGITLGFHRTLTHRSLRVNKYLEPVIAIVGVLALQGGPIEWIATHRAHHAHTDTKGDPHDIHQGGWWSHMAWLYRHNDARLTKEQQTRLAPDLAGSKFYQFLEKTYVLWSWLIWGIFVRCVVVYHITWLVNSAAHMSGYQSFRTGDKSMNNWWVAILAWGEGWHNNHHAFPSSARHGLRWFEIDLTWMTIKVLSWLRLARDIKLPTPAMIARLSLKNPEKVVA
jgi:stearoyl-CoA desaturase (delta-9 desaturase)